MKLKLSLLSAACAASLSGLPSAHAETIKLIAELKGASEVPPVDAPAAGKLSGTFDTDAKIFTYALEHMKLSGDATAAHFHGPASIGENAGVAVPIDSPLISPIERIITLNDKQADDLLAEKWCVNIHTAKHGPGEIRGQVTKQSP